MSCRYETHLHTSPVSKCARASVRETLEFYKSVGYSGVFITNHFIDCNINVDPSLPYADRINFYFSDYEEGVKIGKEIDFPVFCGVEVGYDKTDFLVYGLDKQWFLDRPEIETMKKSELLPMMMEHGALVIQAHPFREKFNIGPIDHIRLYPSAVHGVETLNISRPALENNLAEYYAKSYGLLPFAGSDNHIAGRLKYFAGVQFETPLRDVQDFIERVKNGEAEIFTFENPLLP